METKHLETKPKYRTPSVGVIELAESALVCTSPNEQLLDEDGEWLIY